MKRFSMLLISLLLLFSSVGCSTTFNNTEYKYLSNIDNYHQYEVKLSYFKVYNPSSTYIDYKNYDVYIYVTFLNIEDLNHFQSTPLENVNSLESYPNSFLIHKSNSLSLANNNFYEEIEEGDTLTIWACHYVTKFGTYNYLSSITSNDKTYLSIEQGMENIIKFLDDNRSPWFN